MAWPLVEEPSFVAFPKQDCHIEKQSKTSIEQNHLHFYIYFFTDNSQILENKIQIMIRVYIPKSSLIWIHINA